MIEDRNIFLTGGSGTLGQAFIDCPRRSSLSITVFSRDPMKQARLRNQVKDYQFVDVQFVVGDVRDDFAVLRAMAGHDLVIHAAAMKHIPQAEKDPDACYEINVQGSRNVLDAALRHGIKDVVLISTDKACHPVNVYGCSKMMMERLAFSYVDAGINVYIPRYGNVIDSTGSVVQVWHKQMASGRKISITDPKMTRFWLTPDQAVDVIMKSMEHKNMIYVPKLPALSILKLAQYTLGEDVEYETIGLRPGEKIHEELMTKEESAYSASIGDISYLIRDINGPRGTARKGYVSNKPGRELTREETRKMLGLDD